MGSGAILGRVARGARYLLGNQTMQIPCVRQGYTRQPQPLMRWWPDYNHRHGVNKT